MSTPLRFIPEQAKCFFDRRGEPIAVVEITIRTIMGVYLLKPTDRNRSLILGVLGRAQEQLDFELYGYAYLSNHGSLLIGVRDAGHMARVMEFVHSNTARELGRTEHSSWRGRFWARRGRPILVLSPEDLVARMRYLLSNSTKEGLVSRPTRWPGAHCAKALCEGRFDVGVWVDRTTLGRLRRKAGAQWVSEAEATTHYRVRLHKLPCWAELSDEEYRLAMVGLCRDISEQAAAERKRTGIAVAGIKRLLRLSPHHRPGRVASSPAPFVHCSNPERRLWFRRAYRAFQEAYRAVHRQLSRVLDREQLDFPPGGVPPAGLLLAR